MAQTVFQYSDYENIKDLVITTMADSLTVRKRFDIGCGYNSCEYSEIKILDRILSTTDTKIDLTPVKNRLKKLSLSYE